MYRELKSGRKFKKTLFFLIKDYYPRNDHKTNRHNRENGGERERERERERESDYLNINRHHESLLNNSSALDRTVFYSYGS